MGNCCKKSSKETPNKAVEDASTFYDCEGNCFIWDDENRMVSVNI